MRVSKKKKKRVKETVFVKQQMGWIVSVKISAQPLQLNACSTTWYFEIVLYNYPLNFGIWPIPQQPLLVINLVVKAK